MSSGLACQCCGPGACEAEFEGEGLALVPLLLAGKELAGLDEVEGSGGLDHVDGPGAPAEAPKGDGWHLKSCWSSDAAWQVYPGLWQIAMGQAPGMQGFTGSPLSRAVHSPAWRIHRSMSHSKPVRRMCTRRTDGSPPMPPHCCQSSTSRVSALNRLPVEVVPVACWGSSSSSSPVLELLQLGTPARYQLWSQAECHYQKYRHAGLGIRERTIGCGVLYGTKVGHSVAGVL